MAAARKILTETGDSTDDARTLIDHAERLIFAVSQQDVRGDFVPTSTLLSEGVPRIESLVKNKGGVTGY
jgi:replicative DNA helicase